jgi:predicted ATP-binding protein involved in virulence
MYLKNIIIENMGAIERFELLEKDLIKVDKSPKVVIMVGQNGSGKTTLLSSIVDALYELANQIFDNVLPKQGIGHKYFKVLGLTNMRIDSIYGFSYLQFSEDNYKYEYLDKNGQLSFTDCQSKTNKLLTLTNQWKDDINHKAITNIQGNENFSKDFEANSYCYFPSDRFEYPYWLNNPIIEQNEQFSDSQKFNRQLDKEILIRRSLNEIKNWILDVFLDSQIRVDVDNNEFLNNDKFLLSRVYSIALNNIEKLISEILQKEIKIELNYRTHNNSRLKLVDKTTRQDVLPSLNNLSAGQSTLLSIFANIIKSSDVSNLSKSIVINEISGIVVIDEIDLHLHIELQKEILPKLIKLFPKVQFIITSHSPFFLNGMAKTFEQDDYIVVNMPSGKILNAYDEFEEFNKAYEIFEDLTNDYKKERDLLKTELEKLTKPRIITEGKTDWKHLKKALERFKSQDLYSELDIEFFEYEDNIEMGDSYLHSMVESFKKTQQPQKTIFIFDRDNDNYTRKYANDEFNNHSNNVYSFCIPKIDEILDKISLEFYYEENDLKTIDCDKRRLFLGKEFYSNGNSKCGEYQAKEQNKCDKLVIIDSKVYERDDLEHKNSLALTKNSFSENILKDMDGFNSFDIENFKKIFDVIEKILNEYSTK